MSFLLSILNHPAEAFRSKNKAAAWLLVTAAILINTVFAPILSWVAGDRHPAPNLYVILHTTLWGFVSYLAVCTAFWIICKCFGSKTPFDDYIQTWGLTFFPTILCSLAVAFSETYFTVFWNNSIWGMLLSVVFVGILIWKTILYMIFLREVADLKGSGMIFAFIAIGIVIIVLAMLNGYFGLKTPIL